MVSGTSCSSAVSAVVICTNTGALSCRNRRTLSWRKAPARPPRGAGAWSRRSRPRVRTHCRFRNRGPASRSEPGVKRMSGGATRRRERALRAPRRGARAAWPAPRAPPARAWPRAARRGLPGVPVAPSLQQQRHRMRSRIWYRVDELLRESAKRERERARGGAPRRRAPAVPGRAAPPARRARRPRRPAAGRRARAACRVALLGPRGDGSPSVP